MTLRAAAASCARSAVCKCFPEAALLRAFPESCLQRLRGRVRRCLRTAFPGAEMRLGGTLSRGETRSRPLSPGSCSEDVGVTAGRDRDFDGTRHGSSRQGFRAQSASLGTVFLSTAILKRKNKTCFVLNLFWDSSAHLTRAFVNKNGLRTTPMRQGSVRTPPSVSGLAGVLAGVPGGQTCC